MLKMSKELKGLPEFKASVIFCVKHVLGVSRRKCRKNHGLYQSFRTLNSDLKIFGCFCTFNSELYILNLFSMKLWSKMGNKFEN